MNTKILIYIVLLFSLFMTSCNEGQDCNFEHICQQKNAKIIQILSELSDIGQKFHCQSADKFPNTQIEQLINKLENNEELLTLAMVSRSLVRNESNEVPTCRLSKSDNVFDSAYWECVKRIAKSSEQNKKEILIKLRSVSFFSEIQEERYYDEILIKHNLAEN